MAFNVRIFGYSGITQVPQVTPHNFAANGPWVLTQPYNWSQLLTTAGASAVTTTAVSPDVSQAISIEVADGNAIRFEINPPNRAGGVITAGNNSPRMSGVQVFSWGVGWTVSIVDASFYP